MFKDFKEYLGECVFTCVSFLFWALMLALVVGVIGSGIILFALYPGWTLIGALVLFNPVTCALYKAWMKSRERRYAPDLSDVLFFNHFERGERWLRHKLL